jgi:hypothetical protein
MKYNDFMRSVAAIEWRLPRAGGLHRQPQIPKDTPGLLLPGAFLMPIGAKLFAPFMFVDLAFATFL